MKQLYVSFICFFIKHQGYRYKFNKLYFIFYFILYFIQFILLYNYYVCIYNQKSEIKLTGYGKLITVDGKVVNYQLVRENRKP